MQPFEHVTQQLFPNHLPRTNFRSNANITPSATVTASPESSQSANPPESALSTYPTGAQPTTLGLPVAPRTVRTFACGHVIPPSQVGHRVRMCVPDVLGVRCMKLRCTPQLH